MKRHFKGYLLSFTVFLLGLITLCYSYLAIERNVDAQARGFTVKSSQSYISSTNADKRVFANSIRQQKSNGEWKEVTTYFNAENNVSKKDITFAKPGKGVFKVSREGKYLILLSPMGNNFPIINKTVVKNSPNFLREENVLDYKTLVSRTHLSDDSKAGKSKDYIETYIAPELQGLFLKRVSVSESGTNIFEPTEIILGEPDDLKLEEFDNLPIDESFYKSKRSKKSN